MLKALTLSMPDVRFVIEAGELRIEELPSNTDQNDIDPRAVVAASAQQSEAFEALRSRLSEVREQARELANAARAIQGHREAAGSLTREQFQADYARLGDALEPFRPLGGVPD